MSRRQIKKIKYHKVNSFYDSTYYDSILLQKMIHQLMKKGKKTLAYKILNEAIDEIEKKTQQDPIQVIEQAIQNVIPAVEIKTRRIGGAVYSIPIELNSERGISIAIRWILKYCSKKPSKPFALKLATEILDASKRMGLAIRKRDEIHKIAESSAKLM